MVNGRGSEDWRLEVGQVRSDDDLYSVLSMLVDCIWRDTLSTIISRVSNLAIIGFQSYERDDLRGRAVGQPVPSSQ